MSEKSDDYRLGYRAGYQAARKKNKKELTDLSKLRIVGSATWIPIEFDGYADGYPVASAWECSNCGKEVRCERDDLDAFCGGCGCAMEVEDNG